MVLLIIIPIKNGYFIGNINPTFSGPNPLNDPCFFCVSCVCLLEEETRVVDAAVLSPELEVAGVSSRAMAVANEFP